MCRLAVVDDQFVKRVGVCSRRRDVISRHSSLPQAQQPAGTSAGPGNTRPRFFGGPVVFGKPG
jgi:hypothetical protein